MAEEPNFGDDGAGRLLLEAEKAILEAMIASDHRVDLNTIRVVPIGDRGMHSLAFLKRDGSAGCYGKEIGRANYIDNDGVPVSISLTVDEAGGLFELDFWTVDFQPMKRYPGPGDLTDISGRDI